MAKDDLRYLGHMADCARRAEEFMRGKSRAEFDADEVLRLAVIHLLQTIGEAARRVSDGFRHQHSDVPWAQIVGMRNRIVHDYLNVDFDIAWQVATADIPVLRGQLSPLLPPAP
jgi:uncharacterized protein with HEPN domain